MKKKASWLLTATLLMFLSLGVFTSCDDDDDEDNTQQDVPVSVTGVSLDVSSLSLLSGGSYTFTATVTPQDATEQTVTWNCSDEAIAQLTDNENGTATITVSDAAEEGSECTVTVTTEDGGFTAECVVTVITEEIEETEPEIVEVSLQLDDANYEAFTGAVSLAADGTLNLQLIAYLEGVEVTEGVTWSATVDANGTAIDLLTLGIMDESGLIRIPEDYIEFLTGDYSILLTATLAGDKDSPYTLSATIADGAAGGEYSLTITIIKEIEISLSDNDNKVEEINSYDSSDSNPMSLYEGDIFSFSLKAYIDDEEPENVIWSSDFDSTGHNWISNFTLTNGSAEISLASTIDLSASDYTDTITITATVGNNSSSCTLSVTIDYITPGNSPQDYKLTITIVGD